MGRMKDLLITIYGGGDEAVEAACELAGIAKERRAYDAVNSATSEITDIVTVLRGVGFASVPPSAGDSASLLHYCVTHAADEIEHLREERRWIPVAESLPEVEQNVLAAVAGEVGIAHRYVDGWFWDVNDWSRPFTATHWMPIPEPPEVK